MAERKKQTKRVLPKSVIHDFLKVDSGIEGQVSSAAVKAAGEYAANLLQKAAEDCVERLGDAKKKTVSRELIISVMSKLGVDSKALKRTFDKSKRKSAADKKQPLLSIGTIDRLMHKYMGKGWRISEDATQAALMGLESQLRKLSKKSGDMALHAKRVTIKASDVDAAIDCM